MPKPLRKKRKRKPPVIREGICPTCGHGVWSHGDYGECGDCIGADPEGPCAEGGGIE